MRKPPTRLKKTLGWLLSAFLLVVYFSPQAQLLRTLPDRLSVAVGQRAVLDAPFPLTVQAQEDVSAGASMDETLPEEAGKSTATISFLGLLPLREVEIDISDDLRLYPGGQAVGVALHTQGVLVVGTSDLSDAYSPARLAGVKAGDLITQAGGQTLESAEQLTALVASMGEAPLPLTIRRGESILELTLTPKRDGESGDYRIGAWGARQHRGRGYPVVLRRAGGGRGRCALARWATPSPTAIPNRCSPWAGGRSCRPTWWTCERARRAFRASSRAAF